MLAGLGARGLQRCRRALRDEHCPCLQFLKKMLQGRNGDLQLLSWVLFEGMVSLRSAEGWDKPPGKSSDQEKGGGMETAIVGLPP